MIDSNTNKLFSEVTVWHVKSIEGTVTVHGEGHITLADKSVHYINALPLSPPLHVRSGGFVMTDLVIKWESCWVSYNASIPPASLSPQTHTHTHTRCAVTVRFSEAEVVVVFISVFFILTLQNNTIHPFLTLKMALIWGCVDQTLFWSRLKCGTEII